MENASEALKMAATVLVFVVALSITVMMFTQINQVSKAILYGVDETKYYDYIETNKKYRIVGLETIIPTLYKYDKEKYTVLFLDESGNPLTLYETKSNPKNWLGVKRNNVTGKVEEYPNVVNKYYRNVSNNKTTEKTICAFDLDDEIIRNEPWTATPKDRKNNLDAFLNGNDVKYDTSEGEKNYSYKINNKSFIESYSRSKFRETIGEYIYNTNSGTNDNLNKNKKKRVIIYQLI